MIIALTGNKGSGKTTIAQYLEKKYKFIPYAFADPIKSALKIIFDWNDDFFSPDKKEKIDPYWGVSPRQMMQFFGTEVAQIFLTQHFSNFKKKIGKNLWVKHFEKFYNRNKHRDIIIHDLRFPHEYKFLKSIDTIVIKIVREWENNTNSTDLHVSEQLIDTIPYDYKIVNNNINEIYNQVDNILSIIMGKQLI